MKKILKSKRRSSLEAFGISIAIIVGLSMNAGSASAATPEVKGSSWNPTVNLSNNGETSVDWTKGKAQGSGLWGFVGDIKTSAKSPRVYTYGLAISPVDGDVWVTDSAKVFYTSNSFYCRLLGGTQVTSSACLVGESKLLNFPMNSSADWSLGQYSGNGTYTTPVADGDNAGIGANYAILAQANSTNGSSGRPGTFGGARGIVVDTTGKVWISDPDSSFNKAALNDRKAIRTFNDDLSESVPSLGNASYNWTQRYQDGYFDYPVGIGQLKNGNIITMSQTAELLKEYKTDGTFVRNIYLHQKPNTLYEGDLGYRTPYAVAVDPADGSILVGFNDQGKDNPSIIQRINPNKCTSSTDYVQCEILNTIGSGSLATSNGNTGTSEGVTFAIAVDPVTENIYVAQRSGQLYVFQKDGTPLGRFAAFGSGISDGQINSVRGIAFDKRGYLYVTTSEGTTSTRVEIFGRTPNMVTNLRQECTGSDSVKLDWDAPTSSDTSVISGNITGGVNGQTPIKDYLVEYSSDGGSTWTLAQHDASTETSRTINALDSSKTYDFRVSAWNEAGNSDVATIHNVTLDRCQTGSFTITKIVKGSERLPKDTEFTFEYSTDGGISWTPMRPVKDRETTGSGSLRTGTEVLVREREPESGEAYSFDRTTYQIRDSIISDNHTKFTIGKNTRTMISAFNNYEDENGSVKITKKVVDRSHLAPSGLTFSGTWSYPAAPDGTYPAGSGSWKLKADESIVLKDIPAGAKVSLKEDPAPSVKGGRWESQPLEPVKITADKTSEITVTNTLTPTGSGLVPASNDSNTLSNSGVSGILPLVLIALLALLAGTGLTINTRRR